MTNGNGLPIAILLLASLSCGGDGGAVTVQPADVDGVWNVFINNAGAAVLTNCTGDLASLSGITIATLLSSSVTCAYSGPLVVDQNGASFIFPRRDFACDNGDYGYAAGGGTVTGTSLSAQLDTISEAFGYAGHDYYSGAVMNTTTIALTQSRISLSGGLNGGCNISPALSLTATRTPTLRTSGSNGTVGLLPAMHAYLRRAQE